MTKKEAISATTEKKSASASTRKGSGGRLSPRQQQQQQQRERPPTPVATTGGGSSGRSNSPHYDGSSPSIDGRGSGGAAAAAAGPSAGSGLGGTASQASSSQASRGRGRGSERSKGYPKSTRRRPPAGRRSSGGKGSSSSSRSTAQQQDERIAEASDAISTASMKSRKDETKQQQEQQAEEGKDLSQLLQVKVEQMERQNKLLREQMEQHVMATKSEVDGLRGELRTEKKRCSKLNEDLKSSREETLATISSKTVLSNRVRELERQLNGIATGGVGGGGGGGSTSGSLSPRTNRVIDLERQLEEAVRTISNLRLQQSHQQSSPSTLSSSGNGGGESGSKDGSSNNSNTQSNNLNRSGDTDANTIGASERLDRAHQQIVILEAERKAEQERTRRLEQRLADLQSNFDRLSFYQHGRGEQKEGTTPAGKGGDQYTSEGAKPALKNDDSPPPITGQQLMELQAAFDRQIQLKPKTTIKNPLHPGNESRPSAWDDTEIGPGIDRKVQVVNGDNATDAQPLSKQGTGLSRVEVPQAPKEGGRDETATESGDETTPFCVLVRGIPPSTTPADVHKFLIVHGVTDISYIKLTTVDDAPETQGHGNVFITTGKGCMKAMSLTGQQMRGHSLHVSPANIRTQSLFEGQSAPSTLPIPHQRPMEAQQVYHGQGQRSPYLPQEPEDTGHDGPLGSYCIYFRGAPYKNTPEEVYDFFVSHGVTDIQSFEVKRDDRTGGTSGDGFFYVKTKEGYEHVLSLHKKIYLGNRYIEVFDGSKQHRSSSGSRPSWADDGGREGRRPSGGVYGTRRDRFSSGNMRTNTSGRRMHQPAGFYNQQDFAMGGQVLAPNHPQALYEGNMYGNPQGQHQQPYGQHNQEYHQQQQQHLHFQHHEGFQGMHPAAPMYGFVAPGYDMHGGNVYPSPQFNPDTTGGGGGWHGGDMGGNIGGAPREAALFPTIDLGMPASRPWSAETPSGGQEGQYRQQPYPVQESIAGPTLNQHPRLETEINVIPPPSGPLDDDDDPPDLINEDSLPSFDQKEDMSYSNIGRDTHSGSAASGGSIDSATELHRHD
mmetsp:Transcript_27761/g.67016  ORF Transcript_27761/g.67016 Transcript_27761/m.67016 type:complete len:1057 (+) Transcript_27761:748-3918(+)